MRILSSRTIIVTLSLSVFIALWLASASTAQDRMSLNSPLPTPPLPTPTPPSLSPEARIALNYVAEKYGIPVAELSISNEHYREYVELGRAFRAFSLFDPTGRRFFQLMVDLADHTVVEDIAAIEQQEADVARQKYGKLEPALYERLQRATDDELVEVAIWIAGEPRRSREELFAELAARFPEAEDSMERRGKPFDVADARVRAQIELAYSQMLEADTQILVQPLKNHLEALGYVVTSFGSLPSITARLPKNAILDLNDRADVGKIYLIEGEIKSMLDSTVSTSRVPIVWARGFDGTGQDVAIIEQGEADFSSVSAECPVDNCFRHAGEIRDGFLQPNPDKPEPNRLRLGV